MRKFFSDIFKLETVNLSAEEVRRYYVQVTVLVNLGLIVLVGIPGSIAIWFYSAHRDLQMLRMSLVILFAIGNILLSRTGFSLLARLLTCFMPLFAVFIVPFLTGYVHEGMLLWVPYGILAVGSTTFALFSYGSERGLVIFITLFFTVLSVTADNLFLHFSPIPLNPCWYKDFYVFYKAAIFIITTTVFYNIFMMKRSNNKHHQLLIASNEAFARLTESLEEKVALRTQQLKTQNERIKSLSFENAHVMRAALARIEGLRSLLELNISEEEKTFCRAQIEKELDALKSATIKLSDGLTTNESL